MEDWINLRSQTNEATQGIDNTQESVPNADDPSLYWVHIESHPFTFRLLRLFGWTSSLFIFAGVLPYVALSLLSFCLVLFAKAVSNGRTTTTQPFQELQQYPFALAPVVALFAMGSYFRFGSAHAYCNRFHYLYEAYRLPVKYGIAVAVSFVVSLGCILAGVPYAAAFAGPIAFFLAAMLGSTAFKIWGRPKLYVMKLPSVEEPLAFNREKLRCPPD